MPGLKSNFSRITLEKIYIVVYDYVFAFLFVPTNVFQEEKKKQLYKRYSYYTLRQI